MLTGSPLLMYLAGLLLGLVAGFFMHRSDYCVAGMFRDAFLFRNIGLLRALLLQIVATMIIFEVARLFGLLPLYPFPLLGSPSLANVVGGLLFGVGMVLAGGCVVGTLYKMGSGSLVSGLAFVGIIVGSGLYAEIHPWWVGFVKATAFMNGKITLAQATGLPQSLLVGLAVLLAGPVFFKWRRERRWLTPAAVAGYVQPWQTALVLAGLGLLSYLLVGMPMGISTTYTKMAAMAENLLAPEHVRQVAYFWLVPLDVVHPVSGALMRGGAGPLIDTIWAIQFPLIVGVVLGSGLSAFLLREFAVHLRVPAGQLVMAFSGGIMVGLASRMAPACNVWHLMGGLPILALQSMLFLVGLAPGAWLGGKLVSWVLLRKSG